MPRSYSVTVYHCVFQLKDLLGHYTTMFYLLYLLFFFTCYFFLQVGYVFIVSASQVREFISRGRLNGRRLCTDIVLLLAISILLCSEVYLIYFSIFTQCENITYQLQSYKSNAFCKSKKKLV